PETHRTDVGVRRCAERRRTSTEDFGCRQQLGVDLQSDNWFVPHVAQCYGMTRCAFGGSFSLRWPRRRPSSSLSQGVVAAHPLIYPSLPFPSARAYPKRCACAPAAASSTCLSRLTSSARHWRRLDLS